MCVNSGLKSFGIWQKALIQLGYDIIIRDKGVLKTKKLKCWRGKKTNKFSLRTQKATISLKTETKGEIHARKQVKSSPNC